MSDMTEEESEKPECIQRGEKTRGEGKIYIIWK